MTTNIRRLAPGWLTAAAALFLLAGCARTGPAVDTPATSTSMSSETQTTPSTSTATVRVTSDQQTTMKSPPSSPPTSTSRPTLSCANVSGVALSLAPDFVGQPSPLEAARWFVARNRLVGDSDLVSAPWSVGPTGGMPVYVTTEGVILEAVQLPSQTWAIASATYCT